MNFPRFSVRRWLSTCALGLLLASQVSHAQFSDVATSSGLNLNHPTQSTPGPVLPEQHLLEEYGTGEGTCAVDINKDGWTDVIIARRNQPCLVMINQGNGTFTEEAAARGLATVSDIGGIAAGDLANRGVQDLFMTPVTGDRYYLFVNDGTGNFTEQAIARNAAMPVTTHRHNGQSVGLVDYDLDGFLDIHVTEWGINPTANNTSYAVLLRNRGLIQPGTFDNVTVAAGVTQPKVGPRMYGFSSVWADFDEDGYQNLALISDFSSTQFYWNNGDGTFTEGALAAGLQRNDDMGVAVADVNGDGLLDFFVTSIQVGNNPFNSGDFTSINHLYLNQGGRQFTESAAAMGVKFTGWGWGTAFLDIENDGDPDLLATNGIIDGNSFAAALDDPTYLLRHNGTTYDDVSAAFGITDNLIGRSVMIFDYNNDGREDALITNVVGPRSLYRNDTPAGSNHWLRLRFTGTASNRDGYGALVRATVGTKNYTSLYHPTNAYLGQREPLLHIGLGLGTLVDELEIRWPSGTVQTLNNVAVDQILALTEPAGAVAAPVIVQQPDGGTFAKDSNVTLSVVATGAPAPVYVWNKNGVRIVGANGPSYTLKKVHPFDAGNYTVATINRGGTELSQPAAVAVSINLSQHSSARWWNEALLDAIRKDVPNPPVHARNLYSLSSAMWDAYWAYEDGAWNRTAPAFHREVVPPSAWTPNRSAAQNEAISYAAFRILSERFKNSAGKVRTTFGNRWLMQQMGYDPDFLGTIGSSPAAVGNRIGYAILASMVNDGANEANGYADATGYASVNAPLATALSGNTMADMNRWQPLDLAFTVTQNGIVLPPAPQKFVGVNARNTTPFAIVKPTPTTLPATLDPGPQPMIGTATQARYMDEVVDVIRHSGMMDPTDNVMIDVSPGALLNNTLGTNDGTGHPLNPVTGLPYSSNIIKRGDYARILSEYWADGPSSETPPGHWNVIFNQVNDHPLAQRRVGGVGPELSALEWEIRGYMALNGAVHDAACAAWLVKRQYDGPRPISMIRAMATSGQSSLTTHRTYHPQGLPLVPGLIEIITPATAAPGQRHAHLAPWAGNAIAIKAWQGNPSDPVNQIGGVGWILATNWIPYQLETFVSPAFPGYVSGHSTFSAAAAVVLHDYTGSAFFPGGMASRTYPVNTFLTFEKGPSQTTQLQWATYYDAADQAGLSRLLGGIHVAADDFEGRKLGRKLGANAYDKIESMLDYTPTNLATWRQINFNDPANAGIGANDSDAMGDGTANLLKYALGLGAYQSAHPHLPTVRLQGDHLVFEFTCYASKADISYHVEASFDLLTWTEIAVSQAGGTPQSVNGGALAISELPAGAGGAVVSVTDAFVKQGPLPRFLRLVVTTP